MAEKLPLPIGCDGVVFARRIAPRLRAAVPVASRGWKRYRGGQTSRSGSPNLSDSSVVTIPRKNSNDFNPMWIGGKVYFLSDRNGPVTLFSYDMKSQAGEAAHRESRARFQVARRRGPGAIVYEQFGALASLRSEVGQGEASRDPRWLAIFPEVRPRFVERVADACATRDISPNGARAVFEARGEIITVPAEKGDARNLTNTPGVIRARAGVVAGRQEDRLLLRRIGRVHAPSCATQDGMGEVKKIAAGEKPGFYMAPRWSPDSKKIAYLDSHNTIWYVDLETEEAGAGGHGPTIRTADDLAPRMVAGQQVAGVRRSCCRIS